VRVILALSDNEQQNTPISHLLTQNLFPSDSGFRPFSSPMQWQKESAFNGTARTLASANSSETVREIKRMSPDVHLISKSSPVDCMDMSDSEVDGDR
jgi:hypothetical protein